MMTAIAKSIFMIFFTAAGGLHNQTAAVYSGGEEAIGGVIRRFCHQPGDYYFEKFIPRDILVAYCRRFLDCNNLDDFVPRPPKVTAHEACWAKMVLYWFFELGSNPAYYPADSPQSRDIAASYSINMLRERYYSEGVVPESWIFSGQETAYGVYGEVEWFIGSYTIRNFCLKDGIATFEVCNVSNWYSGTRLPATWQSAIKRRTGRDVPYIVANASRGQVMAVKLAEKFPELLAVPGSDRIMRHLPSFGGTWEQIYCIEMEW